MFRHERRPLSALTWSDDRTFRLDDVEYVCRPFGNRVPSSPDRFCILKPSWSVQLYEEMLTDLAPRNIVEIGIYDGGSTALFARLARPEKLVAVDIKPTPSSALQEYLETRGLPRSGVDLLGGRSDRHITSQDDPRQRVRSTARSRRR